MANEIQTITIISWVGHATENHYVSPTFPDGILAGEPGGPSPVGVTWPSNFDPGITSEDAAYAANYFETDINTQLAGMSLSGRISVSGAIVGSDLVLTITFIEGWAGSDREQISIDDWDWSTPPVSATVQNGGPDTPLSSGIASFGSGGGFGSFSHGNGFN